MALTFPTEILFSEFFSVFNFLVMWISGSSSSYYGGVRDSVVIYPSLMFPFSYDLVIEEFVVLIFLRFWVSSIIVVILYIFVLYIYYLFLF